MKSRKSKYIDELGFPLENCRVDIFWDDREEVYIGTIYKRRGLSVSIDYDDGDKQTHNLNDVSWRINGSSTWQEPGDANEIIIDNQDNSFVYNNVNNENSKYKRKSKSSSNSSNKIRKKKRKLVDHTRLKSTNHNLLSLSNISLSSISCSSSSILTHDSSFLNTPIATPTKHSLCNARKEKELEKQYVTSFLGEDIEVDDELQTEQEQQQQQQQQQQQERVVEKNCKVESQVDDQVMGESEERKEKRQDLNNNACVTKSEQGHESEYGSVSQSDINMLLELSKESALAQQQQHKEQKALCISTTTTQVNNGHEDCKPICTSTSTQVNDNDQLQQHADINNTATRRKLSLQDLLN